MVGKFPSFQPGGTGSIPGGAMNLNFYPGCLSFVTVLCVSFVISGGDFDILVTIARTAIHQLLRFPIPYSQYHNSNLFHLLSPNNNLRSQHDPILSMPFHRISRYSSSFTATVSRSWISLPCSPRNCPTYPSSNPAYLDTLSLVPHF